MTKAEYRREVNAVCRSARIAITELAPADAANPVALVKSGRRALAAQRVAARELAEIRAPAESERAVRKWLTLVGRALDSIEASLRAQASIDLAAAATANAEGALLVAEADAAARVLGVLQCVTSAPGSPRG